MEKDSMDSYDAQMLTTSLRHSLLWENSQNGQCAINDHTRNYARRVVVSLCVYQP